MADDPPEIVELPEHKLPEDDVHSFTRGPLNQDLSNLWNLRPIELEFLHETITNGDEELKRIIFDIQKE